jgi:LuxR family maltose regulon positive regulatory protein
VLLDPASSGQATLEYLEHANLFIIPLDNERRWYRYHHLFADLLRQRLHQNSAIAKSKEPPLQKIQIEELHLRASIWYEGQGLELEAFHHAAAANAIERAIHLLEVEKKPALYFRGAAVPVLHWLESLPPSLLDIKPNLWVMYASVLLFISQLNGVEPKLQAAEAALQLHDNTSDENTRDLIGRIAVIRATIAVSQHQVETIITQSRRALEYLHPHNLAVRTATTWTLGYAYQLQGERAAARQAYTEAIAIAQPIGHTMINVMTTIGLGNLQEMANQLQQAAATYQQALHLAGEPPLLVACEAFLGLARISYEWNDLAAAYQYAQQGLPLAQQIEHTDRVAAYQVLLARLKLAQGDTLAATTLLDKAAESMRQHNFTHLLPDLVAAQLSNLLRQGNLAAAAQLAQISTLSLSQARLYLAQNDPASALALLAPLYQQAVTKAWDDQRLKILLLQALAFSAHGAKAKDQAIPLLAEALALAAPSGFIRSFIDEGIPMFRLLSEASTLGIRPAYLNQLLAAFDFETTITTATEMLSSHHSTKPLATPPQTQLQPVPLSEPLSQRELEVLQLVAQGLSNREISERLFLALITVKGHNQKIFAKLGVQRRTEAVARARQLGLL